METRRAKELETMYLEPTDLNGFENACVNHLQQQAQGEHKCEDVTTIAITTSSITIQFGGVVTSYREGTILVGEVALTEDLPNEDVVRKFWASDHCPMDGQPPTAVPVVAGSMIGRDDTVCFHPLIFADNDETPAELWDEYRRSVRFESPLSVSGVR